MRFWDAGKGVKFGWDTQRCFTDVTKVLFLDLGGGYGVLLEIIR